MVKFNASESNADRTLISYLNEENINHYKLKEDQDNRIAILGLPNAIFTDKTFN